MYSAMVAEFGPRKVVVEVDAERLAVIRRGERLEVVTDAADPAASAKTSHATICAVLAGECTVLEALWTERLELRGAVGDLLALESALRLFVQGAVRAPSLPGILRSFRRKARET